MYVVQFGQLAVGEPCKFRLISFRVGRLAKGSCGCARDARTVDLFISQREDEAFGFLESIRRSDEERLLAQYILCGNAGAQSFESEISAIVDRVKARMMRQREAEALAMR